MGKCWKKSVRNIRFMWIEVRKKVVNEWIDKIVIGMVEVGFGEIKVYYLRFLVG